MKYLVSIFIISLFVSCTPDPTVDVLFSRFQGEWQERTDSTLNSESWSLSQNKVLGTGRRLKRGEMLGTENISIQQFEGSYFYSISSPGSQNALYYKLTKADSSNFVFTNPDYAFPRWITYSFKGNDSLYVLLGGEAEGGFRTIKFRYKKVK